MLDENAKKFLEEVKEKITKAIKYGYSTSEDFLEILKQVLENYEVKPW